MTEDQPQQACPPPRTREAVDCWLRKWGRSAAVEGKEPLTRQDVLRLIKANGGTAEWLVLFGRNMREIDLERANLQGAVLRDANLQGAVLWWANLQDADLRWAKLQGADLDSMHISRETSLEGVTWHKGYVLPSEQRGDFLVSESTYRMLKIWHQEHGFYVEAGEIHLREWSSGRKLALQSFMRSMRKTRNPWRLLQSLFRAHWTSLATALVLAFYEQLFGYGERPWRVVRAAVAVVLGLALAYRYFGAFAQPVRFIDALYFSAVSFSALGYGSWAPAPLGWARYIGVAESFLGVFTIALFLVTFTRKMVR